ncbi:MAG: FadR/GntR family transcriptional regulator [Thalassotalea sp.]
MNLIYDNLKSNVRVKTSLADEIMQELGLRIVSGTYQADEYLDDEITLSKRFQVSKGVIHEAVKGLAFKGLIEARRGVGIRVRSQSEWKILDDDILSWMIAAPKDLNLLKQLIDIRLCFEPNVAKWVAERGNASDINKIAQAFHALTKPHQSYEALVTAICLFHKSFLQASDNEFLNVIEGVIYAALLINAQLTEQNCQINQALLTCYRKLYISFCQKDGEAAYNNSVNLLTLELKTLAQLSEPRLL